MRGAETPIGAFASTAGQSQMRAAILAAIGQRLDMSSGSRAGGRTHVAGSGHGSRADSGILAPSQRRRRNDPAGDAFPRFRNGIAGDRTADCRCCCTADVADRHARRSADRCGCLSSWRIYRLRWASRSGARALGFRLAHHSHPPYDLDRHQIIAAALLALPAAIVTFISIPAALAGAVHPGGPRHWRADPQPGRVATCKRDVTFLEHPCVPCFGLQDTQPPPSLLLGEGSRLQG
jgi:hypothetical protein